MERGEVPLKVSNVKTNLDTCPLVLIQLFIFLFPIAQPFTISRLLKFFFFFFIFYFILPSFIDCFLGLKADNDISLTLYGQCLINKLSCLIAIMILLYYRFFCFY